MPKTELTLPVIAPLRCPICEQRVAIFGVTELGAADGEIVSIEYECVSEPDIDSDEWNDWHRVHFARPIADWLPWETKVLKWLNKRYTYSGGLDR